jgi:hypothetical protein
MFLKLQDYPYYFFFVSCCFLLNAGIIGRAQFPSSSQPQFTSSSFLGSATPYIAQLPSASNYGFPPDPYAISQVVQPHTTIAAVPSSGQMPGCPMRSPQYFLNQSTPMWSSPGDAPIARPVLPEVHPGVLQLNYTRSSPLSIPSVGTAMVNFGNIQV